MFSFFKIANLFYKSWLQEILAEVLILQELDVNIQSYYIPKVVSFHMR